MLPDLENPWSFIESRSVVRNPWFHLRRDRVSHRRSGEGEYWVIEARPALGVIAMDDRQRITLVGQYRYTLARTSWELPEGGGEPGETLLETAMRELQEETGLRAEHWTLLGKVHTSNCFSDEEGTIFLAQGLQSGLDDPDPTEELHLHSLTIEQSLDLVRQGRITDAITVAGLYFCQDHLAGRLVGDRMPTELVRQVRAKLQL
jgi:8-oxo-dGTP pyrophosphatase MutT (NUDIX family)